MSEESEKEESEKEEGENEEGENEEKEENEEGENEEKEESEEEDKKKKKKDKEIKEEIKDNNEVKFETDKLVLSKETKVEVNNNNNSVNGINYTMGNVPVTDRQKSLSEIISEVNFEMDGLSKQIEKNFINLNYNTNTNYHPIINKNDDNLDNLFIKAKELTRIIDNENLKDNNYITSYKNNNDNYLLNQEMEYPFQNNNQYKSSLNNNPYPYDPNKNKEYYSSLNNLNNNMNNINLNNQFSNINRNLDNLAPYSLNQNLNMNTNTNININTNTNMFNSSRIKRMDDLYRSNLNKKPKIYSQSINPKNINIPIEKPQQQFQFNNNFNSGQRNFERIKPQSINQAVNILLDKY